VKVAKWTNNTDLVSSERFRSHDDSGGGGGGDGDGGGGGGSGGGGGGDGDDDDESKRRDAPRETGQDGSRPVNDSPPVRMHVVPPRRRPSRGIKIPEDSGYFKNG